MSAPSTFVKILRKPILVFLSIFIYAVAGAQDKPKHLELNEMVVTGQYEANSLNKTVQKVRVIEARRIEQQGAFTLQQVLVNELNIRVVQDPILGSGIQLQGVGGNNIKVLIDGVPVIGRENGNVDLSQISLQNVERIEFVEGPMSVNYGTDALGGVINIITKKQKAEKKNLRVGGYAETIGQYNFDISGGKGWKNYGLQASAGRNFFQGFSVNPDDRDKLWNPKTQYNADCGLVKYLEKGALRWSNQYFHEKLTDRGVPNVDWTQAVALDRYFYTDRYTSSIYYDKKFDGKRNINLVASYNFYRRQFNTVVKDLVSMNETIVPSSSENDTNWFHQLMSRGTYANVAFRKRINYQMGYEFNHEFAIGERIEEGRQNMGDYNLFASAEWKPGIRWMIRPAFRLIYHTVYTAPFIPSIHFKYDITENTLFRASYAKGFRAPSLKELYLKFTDAGHNIKGNPNLEAEVSHNIQIGLTKTVHWENRLFRFEPTLFYNQIKNMIDLARTGNSLNAAYQYVNINQYYSTGISLNAEYRTIPWFVSAGYALTGRKNALDGYSESNQLFYSNEIRCNAGYNFTKWDAQINIFGKWNGRLQMYQLDYLNNTVNLSYIDPYFLFDITMSKTLLKKKASITAGVKNLLDIVNVNASYMTNPHSGGSGFSSIGMGRSVFVSAKYFIF